MANRNYRHGDIYLIETDLKREEHERGAPVELKVREDRMVARGEATGHVHVIDGGTLYVREDGTLVLEADSMTQIRHVMETTGELVEHGVIQIEPGLYDVRVQREYQPDGWRQVAD